MPSFEPALLSENEMVKVLHEMRNAMSLKGACA
jgi:hypothetical protein